MVGRRVEDPTPGHEGWVRSRLRDGQEVYVAFATAPLSGWRVIITSPVASVEAPLRRALWQLLVGGAVAAALASTLAFVFGRRIAGAVGSLVRIARAVERGQRAQPLQHRRHRGEHAGRAAPRRRRPGPQARGGGRGARASGARHQRGRPRAERVAGSRRRPSRGGGGGPQPRAGRQRPHRARGRGWRSVLRYSTQASTAAPPGLRDRARPRHRWSGPGHGPAGADRRLSLADPASARTATSRSRVRTASSPAWPCPS